MTVPHLISLYKGTFCMRFISGVVPWRRYQSITVVRGTEGSWREAQEVGHRYPEGALKWHMLQPLSVVGAVGNPSNELYLAAPDLWGSCSQRQACLSDSVFNNLENVHGTQMKRYVTWNLPLVCVCSDIKEKIPFPRLPPFGLAAFELPEKPDRCQAHNTDSVCCQTDGGLDS